jgi:DNA-binding NarL/FixJ family response regulator
VLRILLVDDHAVVREGLRSLLESKGLTVVGEAWEGRQAIELARTVPADVAVVDIGMQGLNGLDAARGMMRAAPHLRIVMLTMHTEDEYVVKALQMGAGCYVVKSQAGAELVRAIEAALRGRTYLSPGISHTLADAVSSGIEIGIDPLTAREREVLQLISEGNTTKEVASTLGISVKTAGTHRTSIMRKLGVHETAGLVRYAIRVGLTSA